MNPFHWGHNVEGAEFCPRPQLIAQIRGHIEAHHRLVIQGARRVGKTSAIRETIRRLKRRLIYVDLMEVKSVRSLAERMGRSLVAMEHQNRDWLQFITRGLKILRPVLNIDEKTGLPKFTVTTEKVSVESLDEILDQFAAAAPKKPLVVVFDEFQDILKLPEGAEAIGILRGRIQQHSRIPYIFSGSIRSRMWEIFHEESSPFYKSAATIEVGPIDKDAFQQFIANKFRATKRQAPPEVLDRAFEIADQIPGDVQQMCAALWDVSTEGDTLSIRHVERALHYIFAQESKGYELTLTPLTDVHTRCLLALSRLGGFKPFSTAFMREMKTRQPAQVRQCLARLIDLKIIFEENRNYRFSNPFFKYWLLNQDL